MQRSRPRSSGLIPTFAGFITVLLHLNAVAADASATNGTVVVQADGSVVTEITAAPQSAKTIVQRVRLDFGLPRKPPERRWLEDERLPICHTLWEKDGIRYTQTVLVTRLGAGDVPASVAAEDAILMVQVTGENFADDYTEATAGLTVQADGRVVNLELRDTLIYATDTLASALLAAIEIPASGIASTNGRQLRFQGNMPPGNTGAMTVKVPFGPVRGEAEINRLLDLQFSEELQRVKRFWQKRGDGPSIPVMFSK